MRDNLLIMFVVFAFFCMLIAMVLSDSLADPVAQQIGKCRQACRNEMVSYDAEKKICSCSN